MTDNFGIVLTGAFVLFLFLWVYANAKDFKVGVVSIFFYSFIGFGLALVASGLLGSLILFGPGYALDFVTGRSDSNIALPWLTMIPALAVGIFGVPVFSFWFGTKLLKYHQKKNQERT